MSTNGIESQLEKTTDALSTFIHANKEWKGEFQERLMSLEQSIARRPGGSGPLSGDPDGAGSGSLADDILSNPNFSQLRDDHVKSLRFKLPGRSIFTKAAILGSNTLVQAERRTEIVTPAERRFSLLNLIPSTPTTSNVVEFTRETTFTNSAAPQFESSPIGGEGAVKPESSFSYSLVQLTVQTLAHWTPASRQVLDDAPQLRQLLDKRLRYGLQLELEREILNGSGANNELSGLLLSGNHTVFSRGASADTQLDTLRKAQTMLELNDHVADVIILNPAQAESISLAKDLEGRYVVSNALNGMGPTLWGLPLVSTNAMPSGRFLVADLQNSVMYFDRMDIAVTISEHHSDFFVRNLVAVLAECRGAVGVYRPLGLISGTF